MGHANVEEGEGSDDEETGLPEGGRDPEPDGGGGAVYYCVSCGTSEVLIDDLPYEDGEGEDVA